MTQSKNSNKSSTGKSRASVTITETVIFHASSELEASRPTRTKTTPRLASSNREVSLGAIHLRKQKFVKSLQNYGIEEWLLRLMLPSRYKRHRQEFSIIFLPNDVEVFVSAPPVVAVFVIMNENADAADAADAIDTGIRSCVPFEF